MAQDQAEALCDALVLLNAFASSPWRSLEIASGEMRLSISRLTAAERAALTTSSPSPVSADEKPVRRLHAPHVASLREIAAVGDAIHAGEIYAKIQVLDEIIDLFADEDFCVISRDSDIGQLLEFNSPLLTIK